MTVTDESIKDKTYTVNNDIQYSLATGETTHISKNTWVLSEHVKSVLTNRIEGQIKLRVASRAMLESNHYKSTK
jgi:hypothetical protein